MCLTFFLQFCDIILIPILSIHKIDVKIFILNIICTKHEIFHCFYPLRDLLLFRLRRYVCVCVCVCVCVFTGCHEFKKSKVLPHIDWNW